MAKATIDHINEALQRVINNSSAFQSVNIAKNSKQFLATLDPADSSTQRTIYSTLLGTMVLVMAYEKRGIISLQELETVLKPVTPSYSIAETMQMEKMRHQKLVNLVGERYLSKVYHFEYIRFCSEFPDLKPVLKEINYLINPGEFTKDYAKLETRFDESINLYDKLVGGKLTLAQSQFRDSLILLKRIVLWRCLRNAPLYTLDNCQIIADNVDLLAKKVGGTKFTKNDIQIFSDAMEPFAATNESLAVLLKTLLIAISSMLLGLAVAAVPGVVVGASVGTVGACFYSMWAAPETLPTYVVEDSARELFVQ